MLPLKSYFSDQDDFKKAFAVSIFLHLALVLFFIIKISFFSKPMIDLSQAISVSVSDFSPSQKLPEKIQADEVPTTDVKPTQSNKNSETTTTQVKEKVVKTQPAKKDEINLSKSKAKQKLALEKIKKLSAIEKIKQDINDENAKSIGKPKNKFTNFKKVIAAGTGLTGLDKLEAGEYLQSLDTNIKQAWTLPQWLAKKNLKAQVLVKFNTSGQLLSTKIITSSGNSSYDNYCLEAITKATPFPKVPEKFSEKFSVDGLVVGFPE